MANNDRFYQARGVTEGRFSRRQFLARVGVIGVAASGLSGLLAACGGSKQQAAQGTQSTVGGSSSPVQQMTPTAAGSTASTSTQPTPAIATTSAPAATAPSVQAGGTEVVQKIPKKVLDLAWVPQNGTVKPGSYSAKYLEDNFNVKIKLAALGTSGVTDQMARQQQLATTLAGGEKIDVMWLPDPNNVGSLQRQGLLAEVPMELIEKYAPNTKRYLDTLYPPVWGYPNIDNKNYGIPNLWFGGIFTFKNGWRTDLLDKAGIQDVPQTIDDYTKAFAALKKLGVYGMSCEGNFWAFQFQSIFGGYGVMPMQWHLRDGKVVNDAIQPDAKKALEQIQSWYKAGYIDPQFVSGENLQQRYIAGKFAMYPELGIDDLDPTDPNSTLSLLKANHKSAELKLGPPPKGPGGQGAWSWGLGGNIWGFGHSTSQETIARALQIIDMCTTVDQYYVGLYLGTKGKMWDYIDPSKGLAGGIKLLPEDLSGDDLHAKRGQGGWGENDFTGNCAPRFYWKYGYADATRPFAKTREAYVKFREKDNYPVVDLFGKPDVLPSAGQYWNGLQNLKIKAFDSIARGDQPVSYFDTFVQQWNDKGGTQLEKEANEHYNQHKEIYGQKLDVPKLINEIKHPL